MIYIELSNEEIEYSTEFPVADVDDILHCMEEMVRMITDLDSDVDNYILKRSKEIALKVAN